MLKLIGSVFIFIGALGVGNSINVKLKQHYRQLEHLKELLLLMGNELRYLKMPLPQAMRRIAGHLEEPFCSSFLGISKQLSCYDVASPKRVWQSVLQEQRKEYLLNEEEFQIFLEAGAVLEQGNAYMQGEEVNLFVEQVNFKVLHAREELQTKQRLCRYLCGAGGLFLIIILV